MYYIGFDMRRERILIGCLQVGFLTEWQLYAQQLEGDSWQGNKLDKAKLEKMSG
jgi:hypothetical protein